jgi:hypothetical protein
MKTIISYFSVWTNRQHGLCITLSGMPKKYQPNNGGQNYRR